MVALVMKTIWDLPTRFFHWTLIALIIAAYVTQARGAMFPHFIIGSVIIGLILFRLVWGFVGSRSARFSDFITGPGPVLAYLKHLIRNTPEDTVHMGHNPVGALSVLALLVLVTMQAVSGLFTTDTSYVSSDGPMVWLVSSKFASTASYIHHNLFYWLLLVVIAAHIGAALFYLFVKHDNLIRPMVTGVRPVPPSVEAVQFVSLWRALIVAVVVGAITWGVLGYWGQW